MSLEVPPVIAEPDPNREAKNGIIYLPALNGDRAPQDQHREVEADFLELPNGAFLELVCRPDSELGKLGFLAWSQDSNAFVERFEHDGRVYVPPKFGSGVYKNIGLRLPCGVKCSYESTELFPEICDLIRSYIDLPEPSVELVAAFAFSTWFVDKLTVAPYLWISGPPGSGKTTLLRLLHSLCRRAVLIAGNIPSAVFSVSASLHPALLLDELHFSGTEQSHKLECWLRAGNARGVPVTMSGQLVQGFGAKVLCSRRPPSDTALASRSLHISLVPSRKTLQTLDDAVIDQIAEAFQSRLLMFRFLHYQAFGSFNQDVTLLSPRMRDLARGLMPSVAGNEEASSSLWHALLIQEMSALVERSNEPEAKVVIALFDFCHEPDAGRVIVGQIAGWINRTCTRVGEDASLKPRAVGAIVKALGFVTEKVSAYGRGLRLTPEVRRRIHGLLRSYGLEPSDPRTAGCRYCKETFAKDDHRPAAKHKQKTQKNEHVNIVNVAGPVDTDGAKPPGDPHFSTADSSAQPTKTRRTNYFSNGGPILD